MGNDAELGETLKERPLAHIYLEELHRQQVADVEGPRCGESV